MKIIVAARAGFCFGVKRAIKMVFQTAKDRDGPIHTLGPLIHNPQVVSSLEKEGINEIQSVDQSTAGDIVIIRTHGVTPEVMDQARQRGVQIIDATCPFVTRAQKMSRSLWQNGFQVIIVGEKTHPEVQGLVGWAGNEAIVVSNPSEAKQLPFHSRIGVMAQTTQARKNFQEVIEVLKGKCSQIQVCDTICHATTQRQDSAIELAGSVDVMIVVGGYNSANTRKLVMLCKNTGTPTYHVETANQLERQWFQGVKVAGLTAGASTPDRIIEEVYCCMKEMDEKNLNEEMNEEVNEEITTSDAANDATIEEVQAVEEVDSEEQSQENMDDAMVVKSLRPGDIVKGTVVQVTGDEVLVDVGAKSEGVVPLKELSCYNVNSPQDIVQVGDEINVLVLKTEDNEGRVLLSKERADAEEAWQVLEEHLETGEALQGVVREVVKGGLLVDVGLRAFLPASLVERGYVEDLNQYVGQTINAKVIELNRPRRKVILSRKAILEAEYQKKRQELLDNLQEGEVIKGIVRRLTNFGAFMDIGGIDGLLHISEMAWYRIDHPSDVVNVGDELDVKVLRVDKESEKISLGLKQVLPNPWDDVEDKYPAGNIVEAKVVRLAPFGAFVQLEPGVEGLVHISHLAEHHVVEPGEIVAEGDVVKVKVLSVDPVEKRIRLSIREANGTDFQRERETKREKSREDKRTEPAQPKGYEINDYQEPVSDGSTVTIGEMVGNIFKDRQEGK